MAKILLVALLVVFMLQILLVTTTTSQGTTHDLNRQKTSLQCLRSCLASCDSGKCFCRCDDDDVDSIKGNDKQSCK
ncbi:hypothetical protein CASFOL_008495 [Castilleja foliolosa]|uniref:Uncharacterized protein n=1 Tax=Castilleja foliolosa TaxID=1961234 RepID=A0ABD3E146_9LAMI